MKRACLSLVFALAVVLLTNYAGPTGFGETFSPAIQGEPLETPGQEVLEAVDVATRRCPFVDSTRIDAGGASCSGHLAKWLT